MIYTDYIIAAMLLYVKHRSFKNPINRVENERVAFGWIYISPILVLDTKEIIAIHIEYDRLILASIPENK